MEAEQLHRGRLIDHVHLIARDIEATKRFYAAALGALGRRIEGEGEGYFWSDEIFVSTDAMSTTGATHVHLAFQAPDRATVNASTPPRLPLAARSTASPACVSSITRAITERLSSIPMATTSKRFFTARRKGPLTRSS